MKARLTEHPILFSSAMVQAILALIKLMTRRTKGLEIINKDPDTFRYINKSNDEGVDFPIPADDKFTDGIWYCFQKRNNNGIDYILQCPYGQKGDTLWVKEMYYAYGFWEQDGKTKTGKDKYRFDDLVAWDFPHRYYDNPPPRVNDKRDRSGWFKRSSLFMPRKASRILLEITNIRVERLQEISEADAIAEGAKALTNMHSSVKFSTREPNYRTGFALIWIKINGEDSWNANPWVWVIEFKKVEPCQ